MANYTPVILMTLSVALNYSIVFKKNRLIGNIIFTVIGALGFYIGLINDLATNTGQTIAGFSSIIIIMSIISLFYDVLAGASSHHTRLPH